MGRLLAPTATPTVATGPVAQGEGSADGRHFTFVITQLQRSGATVVLNATVTLAGDSPNDSIQIDSSAKLVDLFVEQNAPVSLQATLTAPPEDVTTVDVVGAEREDVHRCCPRWLASSPRWRSSCRRPT